MTKHLSNTNLKPSLVSMREVNIWKEGIEVDYPVGAGAAGSSKMRMPDGGGRYSVTIDFPDTHVETLDCKSIVDDSC